MKSNKKIGTEFEKQFCEILNSDGWWVHFIEPNMNGSQPFDIIAVKNGNARVFDCKTCSSNTFNINRLEDNQIMAFEKWIRCKNLMPQVAIKHDDNVFVVPYYLLREQSSVKLNNEAWLYENRKEYL